MVLKVNGLIAKLTLGTIEALALAHILVGKANVIIGLLKKENL